MDPKRKLFVLFGNIRNYFDIRPFTFFLSTITYTIVWTPYSLWMSLSSDENVWWVVKAVVRVVQIITWSSGSFILWRKLVGTSPSKEQKRFADAVTILFSGWVGGVGFKEFCWCFLLGLKLNRKIMKQLSNSDRINV